MILLAAGTDDAGRPMASRAETGFYDNTRTALWVTQNKALGWDQRPLRGVPRYNDYNLDAVPRPDPRPLWAASLGSLDIPVPLGLPGSPIHLIDDDIAFRIVGYASYAELDEQWMGLPGEPGGTGMSSDPSEAAQGGRGSGRETASKL